MVELRLVLFNEDSLEAKLLMGLLTDKTAFKYTPLQYAGSKYLLDSTGGNLFYKLSAVSGGRTLNEKPYEFFFKISC